MQSATGRATRVSILRYRANWQAGPLHYLRLLRELRLRARYRRSRPSCEALPPHVSSSWIEIVQAEAHPRLVLCPKSTYARLAERKPSIVFECDDWMPLSISLATLFLALATPVLPAHVNHACACSEIVCHTCSGVAGMARSFTPSGASALINAFIIAAGAPIVPASPQPLAPRRAEPGVSVEMSVVH